VTERSSIEPHVEAPEPAVQINPIARPFAGTPLEPGRKGCQERTIRLAASELWPPAGQPPPPTALSVADRNLMIWAWYESKGLKVHQPSDRHLRRVFNGNRQSADMSARSAV
jgi:hypothetical protein